MKLKNLSKVRNLQDIFNKIDHLLDGLYEKRIANIIEIDLIKYPYQTSLTDEEGSKILLNFIPSMATDYNLNNLPKKYLKPTMKRKQRIKNSIEDLQNGDVTMTKEGKEYLWHKEKKKWYAKEPMTNEQNIKKAERLINFLQEEIERYEEVIKIQSEKITNLKKPNSEKE